MTGEDQKQALQREYESRFAGNREYRDSVWKILCAEFFQRFVQPDSAILDLGAGWGEFINNIQAGKKMAMDLNPDTGRHIDSGVRFINQDCSARWSVDAESLDVVFTSNFLEHLESEERLRQTIVEAHRCLKTGGTIICLGPNINCVGDAYWDFKDHRIPLADGSIRKLLERAGFQIRQCIPRFLPYSMSRGATPPVFLVKLYLKLPLLWRLFGKQYLVIGVKEPPAGKGRQ